MLRIGSENMDKFEEELKKSNNPWIKRIGQYLLSREDLREKLKNDKKSLSECFDYILIEISKKSQALAEGDRQRYACGDDEEIYALAVHYYDEEDIKVEKKNFYTNADGSLTDPLKNINKKSSRKKESKTKENIKKTQVVSKSKKVKKDNTVEGQMSLFDL